MVTNFSSDFGRLKLQLLDALEKSDHQGQVLLNPEAKGTVYDIIINVGDGLYLVLNYTRGTLLEMRTSPHWNVVMELLLDVSFAYNQKPLTIPKSLVEQAIVLTI